MLEKLKFWKREEFQPMPDTPAQDPYGGPQEDPFANRDPMSTQFGAPQEQQEPFPQMRTPAYPQSSPFPGGQSVQQQSYAPQQEPPRDRDTELILARLDAIKSDLDAITQRLRILEQRTDQGRTPGQQRYW